MRKLREDQASLKDAINKCSNTLISRWKKKSRSNRAEILKRTFPGIVQSNFGFIKYFYSETTEKDARSKMHNTMLMPFLSLDDLASQPMRFLSLLHARVDYDTAAWFAFDLEQTKAGWHKGFIDTGICGSAMIAEGPRYGEMVPWNEEQAEQGYTVAFPRASLAIEAQVLLMGFLSATVETLIVDAIIEQAPLKWLDLVGSNFRRSKEDEICSSFIYQAFQSPPEFDVDQIVEIAVVRAAKAHDHLWLLRTEPSYMHNEYRPLQDCRYFTEHIPKVFREAEKYERIGSILSLESTERLSDWKYVVEECKHVKEQQDIFHDMIRPGVPLPEKYNEALTCMEAVLKCILDRRAPGLRVTLSRLRGFESCFISFNPGIRGQRIATTAIPKSKADWYREDPLYWCLHVLLDIEPDQPGFFDAPFMFEVFEIFTSYQVKIDRMRVEQRLVDDLADLGAIWELLLAIRYHRPSRRRVETLQALDLGNARAGCIRMAFERRHSVNLNRLSPRTSLGSKPPIQVFVGSFRSGVEPKGMNGQGRRRLARELLKNHWDVQRDLERSYLIHVGVPEDEVQAHLGSIGYDLTPEYLRSLEKPTGEASRDPHSARKPTIPEVPPQVLWDDQEERLAQTQPAKIKRSGPPTFNPFPTLNKPQIITHHKTPITVTPESYKIYMDMFPSPDPDSRAPNRGVTDWKKFIGAMTDAGFAANHNSGSAVTFVNADGGRIIFHRPHPVAKVDRYMLLSFGKRLEKWFGLDRGWFVSAAKGEKGKGKERV